MKYLLYDILNKNLIKTIIPYLPSSSSQGGIVQLSLSKSVLSGNSRREVREEGWTMYKCCAINHTIGVGYVVIDNIRLEVREAEKQVGYRSYRMIKLDHE